ncbi:MAG TPA: NUDIX hydrolase [Cellvibrio sp.]|nr:NUDIX hydrolase [Cellvibrio sp.]
MTDIKQLDSRIVYRNKWMTVREDRILRSSGNEGIFGVVDKPDFVVIVPVQDGYIHLVEQYRYPVAGRYWELPQGSWESDQQADHLQIAAGELREETGLSAGTMVYVGFQYLAYGYSSQGYHIYFATELAHSGNNLDSEEEDLITRKVPLRDFETMLSEGSIKDATTLAAYSLAKLKGLL